MSANVLVLTGYGINCDGETAFAFQEAGAQANIVHVRDLIDGKDALGNYQIVAVPGGFSFGDDLGSGKAMAERIRHHLMDDVKAFLEGGGLMIGICNGFQVLTNLGLLPNFNSDFERDAALTFNDSGRFEDRWSGLKENPESVCVFTKGVGEFELPVRHSEGKFVVRDEVALKQLEEKGQIALRYSGSEYPANPNGSVGDIAGICDPTGRVFGLMPHPEAAINQTHHPRWTRGDSSSEAAKRVFANAVAAV